MVFLGGSGEETLKVKVLGFEGMGWGVGFDFGEEVGDLESVHVVSPSTTHTRGCSLICFFIIVQ